MLDELLVAGVVAEVERGHRARHRVTRGEMAINEGSRRAPRVRHKDRVAEGTGRSLHRTGGKRNDEVAVHASGYPAVYKAPRIFRLIEVARARAESHIRDEAPILELLNDCERTVDVVLHSEVPIERVRRPVVSAGTRVGRAARIRAVVRGAATRRIEQQGQVGCREEVVVRDEGQQSQIRKAPGVVGIGGCRPRRQSSHKQCQNSQH